MGRATQLSHNIPSGGAGRQWRSTTSDEHIFPAIVCKRLSCEAAIERFHLETGNVEEPEPLVFCCPPEGALRAIGQYHINPIVAHSIPDGIGYRPFLMNTFEAPGNPVVKGEGIPWESITFSFAQLEPVADLVRCYSIGSWSAAVNPSRRAKREMGLPIPTWQAHQVC
jgi:hypothetical protein